MFQFFLTQAKIKKQKICGNLPWLPVCAFIYKNHADNVKFFVSFSQICDKEWHYYVISVDFPVVTLYVDGVTYDPYLVTDDWPIHSSQIDVQLTVGACWQGQRNGVWAWLACFVGVVNVHVTVFFFKKCSTDH